MRFPIWSPRTGYGCVATLIAGAVIAAAVYFVMGAPSFDAPVGSPAYGREEQTLAIIAIATLAGGTWIGTRLERRRLVRTASGGVPQPTNSEIEASLARRRRIGLLVLGLLILSLVIASYFASPAGR